MINTPSRIATLSALTFVASNLFGCATFVKRSDYQAQEERIQKIETAQQQELEDTSKVLRRNSADQGVQIDKLEQRVAELEGSINEGSQQSQTTQRSQLDELQKIKTRLDEIARATNMDLTLDPSAVPADKKAHFAAAQDALRIRDLGYARALFREYIRKYSEDDKADNAQYSIAKSYLLQGKPAKALDEFRSVISSYKKSEIMDRTLFDMAQAFYEVGACKDAETALGTLVKQYKKSELFRDAQKKLQDLASAPVTACNE